MWTEQAEAYMPQLQDAVHRSESEIDGVLELVSSCGGTEPRTALDIGCGIGRHSIELARRGIDTTGIDISDTFLDEATERANAHDQLSGTTRFLNHDMRNLDELADTYDLAVCLFNTFGYYDHETNRQILTSVSDTLTDEGSFVMSVNNREWLDGRSIVTESADGSRLYVVQYDYRPETAVGEFGLEILIETKDTPGYDEIDHFEYELRLYSPVELRNMLDDAGFSEVRLYENFRGDPLEMNSDRIVAVAQT